jgi:hypothetical protein
MMQDPVAAALEIAHTGSLRHDGPGRTDDLEISVPGESFVIPADIVSSMGQGNTAAGLKLLEQIFPPTPVQRASGGPVPIVAAGGEFIVGPDHVARLGSGDMKKGHDTLRKFVKAMRNHAIKTLKKLPDPSKG